MIGDDHIALGIRGGIVLSAFVILFAFLGLSPELSWLPEVPLLVASIVVPLVGYSVSGFLAARHSRRTGDGVVAGALAGIVSGLTGGLCFVLFGKSPLNVPVGVVLGCTAGGVWGAVGAIVSARSRRASRI